MSFFGIGAIAVAGSVAAAGGAAAVVAIGVAGAALETTAYSTIEQKKAAGQAAGVDQATADYNARYDESMAQQLDLDTIQNERTERQNDSVYLSREAASYAAAGVLATTGSPLAAQITNAGRFEQQIQQSYVNSQQKQQQYASAATVGRLEGAARADADRMSGTIALINGGAKMAGQLFGDYNSGVFDVSAGAGTQTSGLSYG